jgi:hypothetical protein
MNDDAQLIKAALDRRFSRAVTPPCPDDAWRAATSTPATIERPRGSYRGFAYAAALAGVIAIGGLAAQAATSGKLSDTPFLRMFVSSKPLQPIIHRADRLTIAEAQRRMPFPIVVPTGLPPGSEFLYAHVIKEQPTAQVALNYQAHTGHGYYRIAISESTVAIGPAVVHLEYRPRGVTTKVWNLPLRRWKHGDVVMEMFAAGMPSGVEDRIVRANTL